MTALVPSLAPEAASKAPMGTLRSSASGKQ